MDNYSSGVLMMAYCCCIGTQFSWCAFLRIQICFLCVYSLDFPIMDTVFCFFCILGLASNVGSLFYFAW